MGVREYSSQTVETDFIASGFVENGISPDFGGIGALTRDFGRSVSTTPVVYSVVKADNRKTYGLSGEISVAETPVYLTITV